MFASSRMIELSAAMEALFADRKFALTAICFSLRHATLLACFSVERATSKAMS